MRSVFLFLVSATLMLSLLVAEVSVQARVHSDAPPTKGSGLLPYFESTPALAIPDGGYVGTLDGNDGFGTDAGMVCDAINTFGQAGRLGVTVVGIQASVTHSHVGDLVLKLQSPSGAILTILNRPGAAEMDDTGVGGVEGSDADWSGTFISFDDDEVLPSELMGVGLGSAQSVCDDDGVCAYSPHPGSGAGVDFQQFFATEARGLWTLCAGDRRAVDAGVLESWRLDLVSPTDEYAGADPVLVEDDGYLGILGNPEGFGPEAGMTCKAVSTDSIAGGWITSAQLAPSVDSPWIGNLTFKLKSPDGTIFGVMSRPGAGELADNGSDTPFGDSSDFVSGFTPFFSSFGVSAEDLGSSLGDDGVVCLDDPSECQAAAEPDSVAGPSALEGLAGTLASGRWELCVGDSVPGFASTFVNFGVLVFSRGPNPNLIFADGFETGDVSVWSSSTQ